MEIHMKGNLSEVEQQVKEFTNGLMEKFMKGNG
jgi:hypothetical protein